MASALRDAATFINTRPWVRSRPVLPGTAKEEASHPDMESAHFWDPDKPAAAAVRSGEIQIWFDW